MLIRCGCGNVLGERLPDGRVEQRHRGRRSVGPCPDEIVCERCGAEWRPAIVVRPLPAPEWDVYVDDTPNPDAKPYAGGFTFVGLTNPDWVIDSEQKGTP